MPVTIALYRGRQSKRWASRLLAWWQRCDYSHVAIAWQWDQPLYAPPTAMHVSDATLTHGGVRSRWVRWEPKLWELWEIDGDRGVAERWVREHEGARYDWIGLAGFLWRRVKGGSRAWWCSEMVMAILGMPDPWRWDVAHVACYLRRHGRRLATT